MNLMSFRYLNIFFFHYIIADFFLEFVHDLETNYMKYIKSSSLLNKQKQTQNILNY